MHATAASEICYQSELANGVTPARGCMCARACWHSASIIHTPTTRAVTCTIEAATEQMLISNKTLDSNVRAMGGEAWDQKPRPDITMEHTATVGTI